MTRKITLLSFMFIVFLSFTTIAQTADEIIEKNITAMGGRKIIDGMTSMKMVAHFELQPGMTAPITMLIKDSKKIKTEVTIQGMTMTQAFDGESGWKINPFGGKTEAEKMTDEEIKEMKDQANIKGDLYDYKKDGSKVEFMGKEDMEGTEVYKLKLTKKDGDIFYFFIDAETNLLLKQMTTRKMEDKEVTLNTIMSNYKMVDGMMFPFNIETRGDDSSTPGFLINFDTIELNPKIDDSVFKMPVAEKK